MLTGTFPQPNIWLHALVRLTTLLILVFTIFFSLPGRAADVRAYGKKGIVIEGEIIQGDYARLVAVLDKVGSSVDTVSLYSNGGSVFEAIKIGTLIRDLRLRTIAPRRYSSGGNICTGIASQRNCTCLSACVLVFAGGIHHYGNVLGVHRSYVSHDYPKSLRGVGGVDASQQLAHTVNDYLKTMGFPQQFVNEMNATHSHNITLLKDSDIHRYLSGYTPQFAGLVQARCKQQGKSLRQYDGLEQKRRTGGLPASEQQRYNAQRTANLRIDMQCQRTAEADLRKEVFERVMKAARRSASSRFRFY